MPDHATCRHKDYRLTCEQYEGLLEACGRSCETCGRSSVDAPGGKLVIDHDARIGDWAVRGLICQSCNIQIRVDRPVPEWANVYVANPWYKRHLADLGLSAECPPEPGPQYAKLQDFDGRIWWRRSAGWHAGHKKTREHTWADLHRRFGAHNLTLLGMEQRPRRAAGRNLTGRTLTIRIDSTAEVAEDLRRFMPREARKALARLLSDD